MHDAGAVSTKRFQTLEALRGIAALLVVGFHFQDIVLTHTGYVPFGGLFGAGDRGVDLFFVLSGFIIMTTHARDIGFLGRTAPYLYKRLCRVFPSVWIATMLALFIYALHFGGAAKAAKLQPWNVAASLLLLPQTMPALVNVTWTLTYELFFYVLFAVLIAYPRGGWLALIIWQGLVVGSTLGLLHPSHWIAAYYLRPICLEFGIGILCALILARPEHGLLGRKAVRSGLLLVGIATFFGGLVYEGLGAQHVLEPVRILVYGIGPGMLIVALAGLEHQFRVRVPAWLGWLGGISFALYLVNFSVISLLVLAWSQTGVPLMPAPAFVVCAAACIGVAHVFHSRVDQPIQRWLRRVGAVLFGSRPVSGVAPVAVQTAGGREAVRPAPSA